MIVIYRFISPTNRIYIGQTWNWNKRNSGYKKGVSDHQRKLRNSILKYGYENHQVDIIVEFPKNISQDTLNFYEVYWWKYYKDLGYDMLNIRYPGSNGKFSEETKQKMSKSHMGIRRTKDEINHLKNLPRNNKAVLMFDLEGNLLEKFRNTKEINTKKGWDTKHIRDWLKGKLKYMNNMKYVFMYEQDYLLRGFILPNRRNGLAILQYDLNGNFIREWESITKAVKELNICSMTDVINVMRGKEKTCKNFIFRYKKEDNFPIKIEPVVKGKAYPVLQYSKNGEFIKEYPSVKHAFKDLGEKSGVSIAMCCNGKIKTSAGFIWKYKNK